MPRVNPDILAWARETAGLSVEEAVNKLGIRDARGVPAVDRLIAMEEGGSPPTRPTLVKMAKHYRRPLLTFYMSAPPRMGERGQDFRTLPHGRSETAEALLDALIRDVRARQGMVRAMLEEEDDTKPLLFVGSMSMSDGAAAVLASIRETLRISLDAVRHSNSSESSFAYLRGFAEAAGIFVVLIGNLGSHHTSIDIETFRGFALADDIAPFVVINDQDAQSAWSFTLLHELAHLWLGQTGVSGNYPGAMIERFCNDVAGELLLPSAELAYLPVTESMDFDKAQSRITEFARQRNISSSMVTYKLHRAGIIGEDSWNRLSHFFKDRWQKSRDEQRERAREREGGPNYYVVRRHRLGSALIELVRRTMAEGQLTPSKAGKILGVKAANVGALVNAGEPSSWSAR